MIDDATCLSSSIHFPISSGSMNVNPVMLPPGRARLATKPRPTGSFTSAQTIGMVLVNFCNAPITGVVGENHVRL